MYWRESPPVLKLIEAMGTRVTNPHRLGGNSASLFEFRDAPVPSEFRDEFVIACVVAI